MSVKNMNELFRLMEETERTAVMEAGLYKLISGLEHQDTCFHGPEGTWSVPCEDNLETGEQSASDIGDFCEVFDEMSSSQSTSAPPSLNLDCAKSDSEGSSKPYPAAPPSPALSLSNSKSTHSPSPSGSPLYAPKQKCPKLKISAQPANKVLNKESKRNLGQQCNQPDSASGSTVPNPQVHFIGWLNGQQLYSMHEENQDTDSTESEEGQEVYIKKPPNAFMLFMNEQRPNIPKEFWRKGSGAVNSHLAAMWRSMSKEAQSVYFKMAEQLRQIHKLNNPNWSNQLNYGKKRRRDRRRNKTAPLEPKTKYFMVNPGQPVPVMPAPHTYLPQGPFMWNSHPQGPFIQASFSQGSGMFFPNPQMVWNQDLHPQVGKMENQAGCIQNPQPQLQKMENQGGCMQNPQLQLQKMENQGGCMQNPQLQLQKMENQEGCMQNPQLQLHMPQAPLPPYVITCPPQQTYMGNLNEGAYIQNPPQETGTQ